MRGKIAIIDYGMGNLRSVQKACAFSGADAIITNNTDEIKNAGRIILPGVGAFGDAAKALRQTGLDNIVREEAASGKYILGICLGMQLLFSESYEGAEVNNKGEVVPVKGLGLIPGRVVRFSHSLRIPEIGWNSLDYKKEDIVFTGLKNGICVYFAHSYYAECNERYVLATTEYGINFVSAVRSGNIYGMQFHPEKSGDTGIEILKNFACLK